MYCRLSNPAQDFLVWTITRKTDLLFMGTCAVVKNEKNENELGYRFLKCCWGLGFGHEIVGGLIEYCTDVVRLNGCVAYVDIRNSASVRILESSSMRFDRELLDEKGILVRRYGSKKVESRPTY
jgi:ribosomal-protein-alanine N-acetyltransferase